MLHLLRRPMSIMLIAGSLFSMAIPASASAQQDVVSPIDSAVALQPASPAGWLSPRPGRCYPSDSWDARRIRTGKNWSSFEIGGITYICETCINAGNTWACTYDRRSMM